MADYRLSKEADRDIFGIASYTLEHWDEDQVDDYLTGLHTALIFFKRKRRGVLIVRVLHAKMDYVRHI